MRVRRRRRAVRRPARVRDAGVRRAAAASSACAARSATRAVLTSRSRCGALPFADDREAGRVVAAVLEPADAVDQDRDDVARATTRRRCRTWRQPFGAFGFLIGRFQPGTLTCARPAPRSAHRPAPRAEIVLPPPIVAPRPIRDRRHQHAIRADDRVVLDHRPMLVRAVVVRRDRAGAEVHARAHRPCRRCRRDDWPSSRGRSSSP